MQDKKKNDKKDLEKHFSKKEKNSSNLNSVLF